MIGRWQIEAWHLNETDTAEQDVLNSKNKALILADEWKKKYAQVEVYDTKESVLVKIQ